MSAPDKEYNPASDPGVEAPQTADIAQNDYVSRQGQNAIPVQSDNAPVEDNIGSRAHADSDEMLQRDDAEAIDKSNIIDSRTRGAKPEGGYTEPGDEEGLPGPDDGTSAVRGGPI